jgi:hypothetical protein
MILESLLKNVQAFALFFGNSSGLERTMKHTLLQTTFDSTRDLVAGNLKCSIENRIFCQSRMCRILDHLPLSKEYIIYIIFAAYKILWTTAVPRSGGIHNPADEIFATGPRGPQRVTSTLEVTKLIIGY